MAEDMQLRNFSPKTIDAYTYHVGRFGEFLGSSPEHATPEDVRSFQLHLINERKVGWSSFNQAVCGLRFLYRTTYPRDWAVSMVPFGRKPKTLPAVLSGEEVVRLLSCVKSLKHRTFLLTLYAAGLRLSEAAALLPPQSNSRRMERVRITLATDAVPVPLQTVARKLAGVMRQSQVDVSSISGRIVDAMRNQHAVRPTGEVVIKRLRSPAALAKQLTQELFRLSIHGKVRLPDGVVLVDQVSNVKKLRVPVGGTSPGDRLLEFSQSHVLFPLPHPNRIVGDRRPQAVHLHFETLRSQVCKDDRLFVRITARPGLQE
jgi:integrase